MTAVHGRFDAGTGFEIISLSNTTRVGVLDMVCYEDNAVDIALLRLKDGEPPFETWLRVATQHAQELDELRFLSLEDNTIPGFKYSIQPIVIHAVSTETTLAQALYYSADGMSGAPIVTEAQTDGSVHVVGVHIASHDDTVAPPEIKKMKKDAAAEADSVSDSIESLARSIHGHSSYNMMCIANMVPEIIGAISRDLEKTHLEPYPVDSTAS
jgi:hypothetical protein